MKNSVIGLIVAAAAAIAAIVVRFLQYASVIDYSTGFFVEGSGIAGDIIYIIFAAAFVLGIAAAVIDSKKKSKAFTKKASDLSAGSTLAVGAAYIVGGVMFALSAYHALDDGGFQLISMAILAVSALVIGFILLSNKKIPPYTGYLQLIPTVTLTVHAAMYFVSDLVIKRISDELIPMLADVAMVLLFLSFGRFLSDSESKMTRGKTVVYAVTELSLAGSVTVGKTLATLFGGDAVKGMSAVSCEYIGTLIIAAVILYVLYSAKTAADDEKKEETKPSEIPQEQKAQ